MAAKSALATVQDLYLMQTELWKYLDARALDADERKQAKKVLKEFSSCLQEADPRYMGGEDVLQTLETMYKQAQKKVAAKAAAPRPASRPVGRAKKAVAKKVTKSKAKKVAKKK